MPFVVQKKAYVTGRDVATARVSIDQNTSEPYVSVDFNAAGGKAFSDLTDANVGRRLAIVLDGNIHSAPQIRERIPSGRAQITGGFTSAEATDLAIVLRAGALPAPVQVLEERTVGPSLGADSIRQGIIAILASTALVFVFMMIYYRLSGLIADVALGLNLLLLLATMAGFHATLTLPGIAGIVLTIGMAVDTNILIFERIREELRGGKDHPRRHRGGLLPGVQDRHRYPRHGPGVGPHPVPVRDRPGQGLRGDAHDRHRGQPLHRGLLHAPALRPAVHGLA